MLLADALATLLPRIHAIGHLAPQPSAPHQLPPLRFDYWTLHCFSQGFEPYYLVDDLEVSIPCGGFMLLPPGRQFRRGVRHYTPPAWRAWVYFEWQVADGILPEEMVVGEVSEPDRLRQMLWRLNDRFHLGDEQERRANAGLLIELLCTLLLPAQPDAPLDDHHRMLRQLEALVQQPADRSPHLATALHAPGLSYDHRARQFRQWYGESPRDYLMRRRMERAADMIRETELSITAIAEQLGYGDLSYFGRCFKKIHGQSPAHWRQLAGSD